MASRTRVRIRSDGMTDKKIRRAQARSTNKLRSLGRWPHTLFRARVPTPYSGKACALGLVVRKIALRTVPSELTLLCSALILTRASPLEMTC